MCAAPVDYFLPDASQFTQMEGLSIPLLKGTWQWEGIVLPERVELMEDLNSHPHQR